METLDLSDDDQPCNLTDHNKGTTLGGLLLPGGGAEESQKSVRLLSFAVKLKLILKIKSILEK